MKSFAEALALIDRHSRLLPSERIGIAHAAGRVTAAPIHAACDYPVADTAAMDGFVVGASAQGALGLGPAIYAGDAVGTLDPDSARPIMTGAPIPAGGAAVLVREEARIDGERLILDVPLPAGLNIRRRGEDREAGARILEAGVPITPARIGALIAYGVAEVEVRRRPRIAVLPTGDELCSGGIDVNGPMIAAMLREIGAEVQLSAPVADQPDTIRTALIGATAAADLVLTTGGVSAGDRDHVVAAIGAIGAKVHFHGLRIRPGRPTLFASIEEGPLLFGLPGNPIAALVGFRFLVMRAIRRATGMADETAVSALAASPSTYPGTKIGRVVASNVDGEGAILPLPGDQSHRMALLLDADHWLLQEPNERQGLLYPLLPSL